jgi:2'-hydroxyisoflavone reductase
MKILMLGGTRFVGRHIVEAALALGHELTLFHRGKSNVELFPEVERVLGDRDSKVGLAVLKGRSFDVVVDTCGYFPGSVEQSAEALGACGLYVFISSISVFGDMSKEFQNEEDPVGEISNEEAAMVTTMEQITGENYGPLKARCERVLFERFGERALIIRPGLIVGPNDTTDRFTYWPVRFFKSNGKVLAADCRSQPVQQIDVRDLAAWTLSMIEKKASGVYNATGPANPIPLAGALEEVRLAVNPSVSIVWADPALLEEKKVEPWSDLPMILPYDGSMNGMRSVDVSKAIAAGLAFRPLGETSRDTLEWWKASGSPTLKTGLSDEREAELLAELTHPKEELPSAF